MKEELSNLFSITIADGNLSLIDFIINLAGLTGDKWLFPVPNFKVADLNHETLVHLAIEGGVPKLIVEQLHFLYPVLLNTYERKYYLSQNKKFRVTLDDKMNFYRFTHAFGGGCPMLKIGY